MVPLDPVRLEASLARVLNPLLPAKKRLPQRAAWTLVLLVLGHLWVLQFWPGARTLNNPAIPKGAPESLAQRRCQWCDRIASGASVSNSNVLLRFTGYDKTNSADVSFVTLFYFRGTYALYPSRLFVALPNRIIDPGSGIPPPFNPGARWLSEHRVRSILTLAKDSEGSPRPELAVLPISDGAPPLPSAGQGGH